MLMYFLFLMITTRNWLGARQLPRLEVNQITYHVGANIWSDNNFLHFFDVNKWENGSGSVETGRPRIFFEGYFFEVDSKMYRK